MVQRGLLPQFISRSKTSNVYVVEQQLKDFVVDILHLDAGLHRTDDLSEVELVVLQSILEFLAEIAELC